MSENKTQPTEKLTKFNKIWAFTGGLLAAIVAVIAILNYVYQKEEKLVAVGTYIEFRLPEKFQDDLFVYKNPSSTEVENIIENSIGKNEFSTYYKPASEIIEYFEKVKEPETNALKVIRRFSSFIEVDVKNNGLKQADNVTLEISGNGYYQIKDSKPEALSEFTNSISLGSIRPSVLTKIYIWNNSSFSSYSKPLVTYTNGAELIIFKQDKPDEIFSVFNYFPHFLILLVFCLFAFILGNAIGEKEMAKNLEARKQSTDDSQVEITNEKGNDTNLQK